MDVIAGTSSQHGSASAAIGCIPYACDLSIDCPALAAATVVAVAVAVTSTIAVFKCI